MAILSVRPSVRLSRPGGKPRQGEIETPGLHHMIAYSSQVSNEVILVPLGEEIPLEQGHQRRVPPHHWRRQLWGTGARAPLDFQLVILGITRFADSDESCARFSVQ